MAANKHTQTLIAANIHDGLLRDHCVMELWTCVPADIDAAITRRERQIGVLKAMRDEVTGEYLEMRK